MEQKAITKANKILHDLNFDKHRSTTQIVAEGLQEYADQQLRLYGVVSSMPSKEEILKQARKEENYIGNECDIIGAEKTGKFHGFLKGVEWLSGKIK